MAEKASDDAKKAARNEKRVARLMQDSSSPLKLVQTNTAPASNAAIKGPGLRIKDLVGMVAESTGSKNADLRRIVEATLLAIGTALATGKDLNVPPLGKLRVAKNTPPVMTLKLRTGQGPKAAGLALADEGEDS